MPTLNEDGVIVHKLKGKNRLATSLTQHQDEGGVWQIRDGEEIVGDSTHQLDGVATT